MGKPLFIALVCLLLTCSLRAGEKEESPWLTSFPLDKAIKIGNGRHIVVEISDPDCRFSRRMLRYWDTRTDVTRYIFLIALKNHPEAPAKVRFILGSRDTAAAYREVYSGALDFDDEGLARNHDDHGLLELHRLVAE